MSSDKDYAPKWAVGHEDELVPTEFPEDEFPDPDQDPAQIPGDPEGEVPA